MLRQKRFSQRASVHHSLNFYANENISLLSTKQDPCRNSYAFVQPKLSKKSQSKTSGLGQIQRNSNIRKEIQEDGYFSKVVTYPLRERKNTTPKYREKDQLFQKISDLIKHEEDGVPASHPNRVKKFIRRNDRPYTSLSKNRKSFDSTSFGKYQVVLDLTPRENQQEIQDPSKVSTSRALMNYSKVYRNQSGDRFKVKRDKHYSNHFALISAQKVILQEKMKKQKIEIEKMPQKPVSRHRKRRQIPKPELAKHRYAQQEEQYQIDGWQYFD